MTQHCPPRLTRRSFLSTMSAALLAGTAGPALARDYPGGTLPWNAYSSEPPTQIVPGGWKFFTPAEAATVEAIVDRLIPEDDLSVGGKDAGCAVYIDRQLTTFYGSSDRLYMQGPFKPGLPTQGYQGEWTNAERYRRGLGAIAKYLNANKSGATFASLSDEDKDAFLKDMEAGKVELPDDVDAKAFFALILGNTMEGFFADPVYGGNKDMASWKMLGFPGARYDYREYVSKHNQPFPLPPVSIAGAMNWKAK
ncbi:gluconate 2-dehydrogenase subunit 3 family protein [Rhizobium halophytocola]|uniref:Gluconate 2-dehydrogenase gamma chain n=1 Tax=Rhizobium halophytocola TaxID=735519 RepID=A0ABS4DTX3_9HYPH|nr:gluconate 2-dehydrogenase subunit 3 family protein [Rhizobium halophytocola]MBP1849137.1 gluconate 2-dehydrogenase gamma chain [Rhizobium halophytocola]